ncbi:MAG TPA: glycosyltransferase family 2 protein [Steroidobacteraceae bacterium]|nr:glycosyltransferase family 2 protein [Steroidobacteraceae bacterium]
MGPASAYRGKVSVIVPTYNRAYCLADTLQSLQRQTYPHWEALVIDDGSSDETLALVTRLRRDDVRIHYHQQRNQGVSSARNAGLRLADGDWIAFLDSDDSWQPWKLAAQLACLEGLPQVGMIWTDMDAVDATGAVISTRHLRKMYGAYSQLPAHRMFQHERPLAELAPDVAGPDAGLGGATVRWGDLFSAMVVGGIVHTSTVLLRKSRAEAVGFFDERMRAGEDYGFHMKVGRAGPVALLDFPSIHYRIAGGQDQLTATPYRVEIAANALRTRLEAIELDRARISLTDAELRRILASAHARVGEELFDAGEYARARPHLYRGVPRMWRKRSFVLKALLTLLPALLVRAALRLRNRRALSR